jgi:hypothetical protein
MDWIPSMGHPNQQLADALKRLSAAKYGRPRTIVEAEITNRLQAADIAREEDKKKRLEAMRNSSIPVPGKTQPAAPGNQGVPSGPVSAPPPPPAGGSSFLDEWLTKRQQVKPQTLPSRPQHPVSPPKTPQAPPSANVSTPPPLSPQPAPLPAPAPAPAPPPPEPESTAPKVKSEAEIEAEISRELRIARSQAISEMNEKEIIQGDVDAANASSELKLSGDGTDEIFIDVRGNIHQGNED